MVWDGKKIKIKMARRKWGRVEGTRDAACGICGCAVLRGHGRSRLSVARIKRAGLWLAGPKSEFGRAEVCTRNSAGTGWGRQGAPWGRHGMGAPRRRRVQGAPATPTRLGAAHALHCALLLPPPHSHIQHGALHFAFYFHCPLNEGAIIMAGRTGAGRGGVLTQPGRALTTRN